MLSLSLACALAFLTVAGPTAALLDESRETEVAWRSAEEGRVEGRAWSELKSPYDRLPSRAESSVRPPVWRLAQDSAGICVRFVTDACEIRARWTLTSDELAMPHMPATGVSGLDLYGRDEHGDWRWVGAGRPGGIESEAQLAAGLDGVEREYVLYLPLYNGVRSLEIGLAEEASFAPGPARAEEAAAPLVFYGTSITQGGCASRPGMVHTAILGRRLEREVVNLGFSGNGTLDASMALLLGEIDAAVYVLDCLPNMNGDSVAERAVPFVRALREARPTTPILLVEDRSFTNAPFKRSRREHHAASRAALRAAYEELTAAGVPGLHYLEGAELLGADGEGTVDGSHPTDLGFVRQAGAFLPALAELGVSPP